MKMHSLHFNFNRPCNMPFCNAFTVLFFFSKSSGKCSSNRKIKKVEKYTVNILAIGALGIL